MVTQQRLGGPATLPDFNRPTAAGPVVGFLTCTDYSSQSWIEISSTFMSRTNVLVSRIFQGQTVMRLTDCGRYYAYSAFVGTIINEVEIIRLNIERYRRMLQTKLDENARRDIQKMLDEFETKLSLANARPTKVST